MATKKAAAKKVAAETVEEVLEDSTKEELYEEAQELDVEGRSDMNKSELAQAVVEAQEVEVVTPTTKKGIPNNTWTLTYGQYRIDLVEGVETDLPIQVYEYLKRSNCLLGRI